MATLTVYPDPGTGATTTDDGMYAINASWATARSATSGIMRTVGGDLLISAFWESPNYYIDHAFVTFDASALGAGTPTAATLTLYRSSTNGDTSEVTYPANPRIVTATPASNSTIVAGDFDQVGSTSLCDTNPTIATINGSAAGTGHDFPFNATGVGTISAAVIKYATRGQNDLENNTPTNYSYVYIRSADFAGTTTDPKLVITYTTASTFVPRIIIACALALMTIAPLVGRIIG